jgi:hypothetical protein
MKFNMKLLASLFLVASLSGCAQHKVADQRIEKEVKDMVIPTNKTVAETARDFIMNSNQLTDIQKTRLLDLQMKTQAQSTYLKEEIEKNRIVLIQTVLEPKMNQHKYLLLKKKITVLEKRKLENGFNAITIARNIIEPKDNTDAREFYRTIMSRQLQEY